MQGYKVLNDKKKFWKMKTKVKRIQIIFKFSGDKRNHLHDPTQ